VLSPQIRRMARERALQFLFGLDFTGYAWETEAEDFWCAFPARPPVRHYAERLIRGVCESQESLDDAIASALDNWTPDRVGRIERVVLRISLYEMLFVEDVPSNVAINEAIEIAKRFGADETPRFVNGVLDRLMKRQGNHPSAPAREQGRKKETSHGKAISPDL
jgi:transcription antitermination protein NusB